MIEAKITSSGDLIQVERLNMDGKGRVLLYEAATIVAGVLQNFYDQSKDEEIVEALADDIKIVAIGIVTGEIEVTPLEEE